MSLNIVPTDVIQTMDPVTNINNKREYAILRGGQEITYQTFTATSYSTSQFVIPCNPPSNRDIISRKAYIRAKFHLAFTSTVAGSNTATLDLGQFDAPRAYPMSAITSTVTAKIANSNVSTTLNNYWTALSRYYNDIDLQDKDYSTTPAMLDFFQNYDDWVEPAPYGGSGRNPLIGGGDSQTGMGRAGYAGISNVVNPAGLVASCDLEIFEPIYLSPLWAGRNDKSGFIGVNSMTLTWTLENLERIWSHGYFGGFNAGTFPSNMNNAGSIVVTIVQAPSVELKFITPNVLDKIPAQISYPYSEIVPYSNTVGSVASGAVATAQTNNIQLSTVPEVIYVYVRQRNSDLRAYSSDVFAGITNLKVLFGNRAGLLSTMSQYQLYLMSVRNGLQMTYTEFSKYTGSVIAIRPGLDLGLDPSVAPGLKLQMNLQVEATFTNLNLTAVAAAPPKPAVVVRPPINFDIFVVVQSQGTFSIVNGSSVQQIGVFTQSDVLDAKNKEMRDFRWENPEGLFGGSFWSKIRKGVDSAIPYIKTGRDLVKAVSGSGVNVGGEGGVLLGGKKSKASGGKKISRAELKDMAEKY